MTRLFATDLDGTLLGSDGQISTENRQAIHQAKAAGIEVIFVTGRPPRWMRSLVEMTGLTGPALCANGALVLDLASQEILSAQILDTHAGLEMYERLLKLDPHMSFAVELATNEDDFITDANYKPRWEVRHQPLTLSVPEMFATEKVVKFLARPSHLGQQDADAMLIEAAKLAEGVVDITHSDINDLLIEMSSFGVNKGTGLKAHAETLGLDHTQVAAVGDMPNDVPMISWAGRGAAVANAHQWVKEVANEHLPSNDEHGVAEFINRILS